MAGSPLPAPRPPLTARPRPDPSWVAHLFGRFLAGIQVPVVYASSRWGRGRLCPNYVIPVRNVGWVGPEVPLFDTEVVVLQRLTINPGLGQSSPRARFEAVRFAQILGY